MATILNIDTSTEQASICLSEHEAPLCVLSNAAQKDHAAWLHPAIRQLFEKTGRRLQDVSAIGVTAGPGSYTGLRVGMATAKGLCYALDRPLIAVNTLEAMSVAALHVDADYLCPMIDARRMEVFTALYDRNITALLPPCAMILDHESFSGVLAEKSICFFGSGKNKLEKILEHPRALFKDLPFDATHLSLITYGKLNIFAFSSLLETEPLYLKGHYLPNSK